ncbi:T9SS type A sorting domain-containing protein, partial [Bacteroidota bacterium]
DFDWANPDDIKGWTAPEGWQFIDESAEDLGYNFYWSQDSIDNWYARRDGGFIMHSTTANNGWLALDLAKYNDMYDEFDMPNLDNSFILPIMDFTDHSSVIISFEQHFRYWFNGLLMMYVSNDEGVHWAEYNLKMGTPGGTSTNDISNDEVAHFSANISDVAAGMSDVIIKIRWAESRIYFWMIDDMALSEGYDNNMRLEHFYVEYGNDAETNQGFGYLIPRTHAGVFHSFEASSYNFGDLAQDDVSIEVDILKNNVSQFSFSSDPESYDPLSDPDTVIFTETYSPTEFGHYAMNFTVSGESEDQYPDDNVGTFLFHVNDSIYSLSDETMEIWGGPYKHGYLNDHEGEMKGIEFNPIVDCEANSVTMYIPKARVGADFRAVLLEVTTGEGGEEEVEELLGSEFVTVDSAVLQAGWVTLPFEKDGEGEFMLTGHKYIAAIEFYIYILTDEVEDFFGKGNMFFFGVDKSRPYADNKVWYYEGEVWGRGNEANFMIRLNLNNNENIIDGVSEISKGFNMGQNYPNPFKNLTEIDYDLSVNSNIIFELSDITGRTVKVIDEGYKTSGKHTLTLNVSDLQAGIYYYSIKGDNFTQTKKMLISN